MFNIQFNVISLGTENISELLDEEVRYNFLLGNVVFVNEPRRINMDWEWIPLFDFSICMSEILKKLSDTTVGFEVFEFTESDAVINFIRTDQSIEISFSFTENNISISFEEFIIGIESFKKSIVEFIKKTLGEKLPDSIVKYI